MTNINCSYHCTFIADVLCATAKSMYLQFACDGKLSQCGNSLSLESTNSELWPIYSGFLCSLCSVWHGRKIEERISLYIDPHFLIAITFPSVVGYLVRSIFLSLHVFCGKIYRLTFLFITCLTCQSKSEHVFSFVGRLCLHLQRKPLYVNLFSSGSLCLFCLQHGYLFS